MKETIKINDKCNVIYDGRECLAKVIFVKENTFDVITSFGAKMYNIPAEKFRPIIIKKVKE